MLQDQLSGVCAFCSVRGLPPSLTPEEHLCMQVSTQCLCQRIKAFPRRGIDRSHSRTSKKLIRSTPKVNLIRKLYIHPCTVHPAGWSSSQPSLRKNRGFQSVFSYMEEQNTTRLRGKHASTTEICFWNTKASFSIRRKTQTCRESTCKCRGASGIIDCTWDLD